MVLKPLLKLIAPDDCLVCGREGQLVCATCLPKIIITKRPTCFRCNVLSESGKTCSRCRHYSVLAGVSVASHYEGQIKELIQRLKYEQAEAAADILAKL